MDTKRQRRLRHVKDVVIATQSNHNAEPAVSTVDVQGWVDRLSSLLRVGIYVAFFKAIPGDSDPLSFTGDPGCIFSLWGYVRDAKGQLVQASGRPLNRNADGDDGDVQLPEGWEGSGTQDAIRVDATLAQFGAATDRGEWKLLVVLEPADGALPCDVFDELVEHVQLRPDGQVPDLHGGT